MTTVICKPDGSYKSEGHNLDIVIRYAGKHGVKSIRFTHHHNLSVKIVTTFGTGETAHYVFAPLTVVCDWHFKRWPMQTLDALIVWLLPKRLHSHLSYDFCVKTIHGDLHVNPGIYKDRHKTFAHIRCVFTHIPERNVVVLPLSPYSGKWNFEDLITGSLVLQAVQTIKGILI